VYFPAPAALLALAGRFCLTAGGATKAQGLPQQPNQPQSSLGKFLLCFCWEVWRGAAPSKESERLARPGCPADDLSCFSSDPQGSQGEHPATSCYLLKLLYILLPY
jgi:hypothetical protein